jgi:hypothetical protein
MQIDTRPIREIRKEELENYKNELIQQKSDLESDLISNAETVERLRARKDIISIILQQYSNANGHQEFKEKFYNPINESYLACKKEYDEKVEEVALHIRQLEIIIEFIEVQQSR